MPTLLCSIRAWHSSTNCMKLGLQPLLHPISRGAAGLPLLIMLHRSGEASEHQSQTRQAVKSGRRVEGTDGDEANYFHLPPAPCQQTCNLKRSQWSLGGLWVLGEYGFTDEAVTACNRELQPPLQTPLTCRLLDFGAWCVNVFFFILFWSKRERNLAGHFPSLFFHLAAMPLEDNSSKGVILKQEVRGGFKRPRSLRRRAGWNFSPEAKIGTVRRGIPLHFTDQMMPTDKRLDNAASWVTAINKQQKVAQTNVNFWPSRGWGPSWWLIVSCQESQRIESPILAPE